MTVVEIETSVTLATLNSNKLSKSPRGTMFLQATNERERLQRLGGGGGGVKKRGVVQNTGHYSQARLCTHGKHHSETHSVIARRRRRRGNHGHRNPGKRPAASHRVP